MFLTIPNSTVLTRLCIDAIKIARDRPWIRSGWLTSGQWFVLVSANQGSLADWGYDNPGTEVSDDPIVATRQRHGSKHHLLKCGRLA
jgi:hypothetical protein